MSKKGIIIFVLINIILFIAEYYYFRTEAKTDDQEGVHSSIVETDEGPYIEVKASRIK